MIYGILAFVFQGRVCPRCQKERTGHWGRYVTGVPFDEWICHTCTAVEQIKRTHLWRASSVVWGPEVEGADQVSPGLYVGRESHSVFTKDKK